MLLLSEHRSKVASLVLMSSTTYTSNSLSDLNFSNSLRAIHKFQLKYDILTIIIILTIEIITDILIAALFDLNIESLDLLLFLFFGLL